MKSISVVIPNFNGRHLLELNLPSLYKSLIGSGILKYEVIVSDDASNDDSINFLQQNYPNIVIVTSPQNTGFAGNVNRGVVKSSCDLVFILNTDVTLTPNYFMPLMHWFDREDTFGVMGKIVSPDHSSVQDTAKYPAHSFSKINATCNFQTVNEYFSYTLFLTGANALIDRTKLLEMNGFCELFNPYYSEDAELGIRAWRSGYKLYFDDRAVCFHENSATIRKQSVTKVQRIAWRNRILMHYLHINGLELLWYFIRTVANALFKLIFSFNSQLLNALYLFLQHKKEVDSWKRKHINKLPKSTAEIMKFLVEDLKGKEVERF
jgi:GT2 family glycosyltransferase